MINNKIKLLLKKLLCKVVAFYTDQPYQLMLDEHQQLTLQPAPINKITKYVLIVGRQHYNEKLDSYPVGNQKELKKIIALQHKNREEKSTPLHTLVTLTEAERSQVMQWRFASHIPKAWLTLPESLLLSHTLSNGEIIKNNAQPASFVTKHQNNTCSSLVTKLVDSPERFANMFGLPLNKVINIDSKQGYLTCVLKGLLRLPKQYLTTFLSAPSHTFNKRVLLRYSALFSGLLIAYGLLTSTYLLYKTQQLESQLDTNKASVNKAIDTLNLYMSSRDELQQRQQLLQQLPITSPVFLVISDLFNSAELTSIAWQEGRFVLRGKASKATDALASIMQDKRVEDAKFDYPSRKERSGESFVISFVLNTDNDQRKSTVSEAQNQ